MIVFNCNSASDWTSHIRQMIQVNFEHSWTWTSVRIDLSDSANCLLDSRIASLVVSLVFDLYCFSV